MSTADKGTPGLFSSIERAHEEVKRLARVAPHIFHEWQELQQAIKAAEAANDRVVRAQEIWDNVLKGKPKWKTERQ